MSDEQIPIVGSLVQSKIKHTLIDINLPRSNCDSIAIEALVRTGLYFYQGTPDSEVGTLQLSVVCYNE